VTETLAAIDGALGRPTGDDSDAAEPEDYTSVDSEEVGEVDLR